MTLPAARVVTPWWQRVFAWLLRPEPTMIVYCALCGGVSEDSPYEPGCCRSFDVCHGIPPGGTHCRRTHMVWS